MSGTRHRQLFLFLVALILPTLVIAGLWWKLLASEGKLLDTQETEAHQRELAEIGRAFLDRLEGISATAQPGVAATPGPVVLVGYATDGRGLMLPWEDVAAVQQFKYDGLTPDFEQLLAEAQRSEFEKKHERTAGLYRQILQSVRTSAERAFAQDGLARSLVRSGAKATAAGLDIYRRELLTLPSTVVDDTGVPFACWAAMSLGRFGAADRDVLDRLERDLDSPSVLTPHRAGCWREVAQGLERSRDAEVRSKATVAVARLSEWALFLKEARALQTAFPKLAVTADAWKMHDTGDGIWLVSLAERPGARPLVIVVRLDDIRQGVKRDRTASGGERPFRIEVGTDSGDPLNDRRLPDLRVVFTGNITTSDRTHPAQLFYGLSLLVVVGLTLLAGYLAWRDTRREIRIAEMRSQFVASVSHELKTPLTSIRMFAELLEIGTTDESTRTEYLNTIVNESERLTRLLNNVLDFSRIEHGQKSYCMEPTPIDEIVRSAARVMEYPLKAQGFDLRVDVDGAMPLIPADRDAITQAILNLLTNAMKYSGKSRAIDLRVSRDGSDALIQVTDHGIGIPVHEQAHIFEKFYRANVPENQAISGTGLGLALVTHIVNAHGGHAHVESRVGEGTTFSIRLPVTATIPPRPSGPAAAAPAKSHRVSTPANAEARS